MDVSKENTKPNPREKANILSVIFFAYTARLFKKGYTKVLEVKDLYRPLRNDTSKTLGERLEKKWNEQLLKAKSTNKKPNFMKTLAATFWPEYLYLAIILVVMDVFLRLSQPFLLQGLLDYFEPGSLVTKTEALLYAAGVGGIDVCVALLMNQYMMNAFHYGMKIRIACCALIYRKSLKLSRSALGDTASGKIVNLLANDVSRFDYMSILVNYMWAAPTVSIIVTYLMYRLCGYAAIIGIIPFFITVPLQSYIGKISAIYRKQTAIKTDERIRLIDEIVSGMQVIKMYAWEIPFTKLIKWARKQELDILIKSSYVRGIFMTFRLFTTRMALFCTLLTMAMTGQPITAGQVFVFTLFFNELSHSMATMFVRVVQEFAEFLVSIKRIEEFLLNEEFVESRNIHLENGVQNVTTDSAVAFKQVTVKWNLDEPECVLSDLSLKFVKGKLYGIIGPVGSGKSSLLQAILGELHVIGGSLNVAGKISYASQEPWLFSGTVRQNILFGEPYKRVRYEEVVKACALDKDFKQFDDGDLTLVGDRGGSLSGGQKARINLARAVYRDADIYLLDDPLSAVDVHVAKHIFEKCISGYLSKKTRILVTHQVHLLSTVDQIILLNEGKVEEQGSYREITSSTNAYTKGLISEPESTEHPEKARRQSSVSIKSGRYKRAMSQDNGSAVATLAESEDDEFEESKLVENSKIRKRSRTPLPSMSSNKSEISLTSLTSIILPDEDEDKIILPAQEESSKGKVKGSLFLKYHLAGGNICFCLFVFLLYVLAQAAASGVDYFVGFWTKVEESRNMTESSNSTSTNATLIAAPVNITSLNVTNSTQFQQSVEYNLPSWSTELCLYIYGGLIVALLVVALMRSLLFYKLGMICSDKLHEKLFRNVLYATMRFFDTNPSGRIINRFSKDIGGIDEHLPKAILDAGQIILQMVGSFFLIVCVNPMFLILIGILCIIFWFVRMVFLKASKNIKRLEGIMKAPVFTHLNASLQGLATIRACGVQAMLKNEFDKLQDYHTSAWFMYITASSAFGFISDFICALFTVSVTFSFLLLGGGLLAGDVGLAITQAVALTGLIQWGMRQSAEIVNQLISVERVLEYDSLPPEKQPEKPVKAPKEWPNKGQITFREMGLKYDEDGPLILKNLNIAIKPKEKVGIVGRTGAGKSSMISALFRLANVQGDIEIDNINTKDLILQELRSKISIIPQDPVLFSGTLRYNLDPFEEYPDAKLYKAINEVELKDPANIINRLEYRVMDRGANYSVGQRQLICLARALIRNNKILMLDEATANVDPQTDALIQKTIREKFSDCTVLTVAHRLNTIMDSDKVIVMETGSIIEFDHPYTLLQNPEGTFYSMVKRTGPTMCEQLTNIAKQRYEATCGNITEK